MLTKYLCEYSNGPLREPLWSCVPFTHTALGFAMGFLHVLIISRDYAALTDVGNT